MVPPYIMRPGRFNLPTRMKLPYCTQQKNMYRKGRTSHKYTRHILVASWDNDHTIKPMATSSSLNLIGDEVSRLKGVGHAAGSHTDSITDAHRAELVTYNTSIRERSLGALSQA
jgi:hypothetical protein